ncbi:hypothetical protein FBY22_1283 [Streptomyces sp. SLBN-31]|nr:hypothetical protein FBY22_1283 [Streptomyces sp. SLBN-31]
MPGLAAAEAFGHRLPEMYAGCGTEDSVPLPHPAACRPAATAAGVYLLSTLAGIRPDGPSAPSRCVRCTARPSARSS